MCFMCAFRTRANERWAIRPANRSARGRMMNTQNLMSTEVLCRVKKCAVCIGVFVCFIVSPKKPPQLTDAFAKSVRASWRAFRALYATHSLVAIRFASDDSSRCLYCTIALLLCHFALKPVLVNHDSSVSVHGFDFHFCSAAVQFVHTLSTRIRLYQYMVITVPLCVCYSIFCHSSR